MIIYILEYSIFSWRWSAEVDPFYGVAPLIIKKWSNNIHCIYIYIYLDIYI